MGWPNTCNITPSSVQIKFKAADINLRSFSMEIHYNEHLNPRRKVSHSSEIKELGEKVMFENRDREKGHLIIISIAGYMWQGTKQVHSRLNWKATYVSLVLTLKSRPARASFQATLIYARST